MPILDIGGAATTAGVAAVANYAALGAVGDAGSQKIAEDTGVLWESDGTRWLPALAKAALDGGAVLEEALFADSLSGLTDEDPVTTWTGINTWTGAGATRPTYDTTGGPGGGPWVKGDGTDVMTGDAGTLAICNAATYLTAFLVAKTGGGASETLFDFGVYGSANSRFRGRSTGSGSMVVEGRRLDADGLATRTATTHAMTTWGVYAVEARWTDGTAQAWQGTDALSAPPGCATARGTGGAWTTAGTVSATDSTTAALFNNISVNAGLAGGLAALVLVSGVLTPTQIGAFCHWLSARAGLL